MCVCIYTYKSIHHTHTHTHTYVLSLCLSLVCIGTLGIILSNLSVTLRPNGKDLARFEITGSQILILTQSGTYYPWNFWFLRQERKWQREKDWTLIPGFCVHMYTRAHFLTIKNNFTPPKHTRRMCVYVSLCDCLKDTHPPNVSCYGMGSLTRKLRAD